MPHPCLEKFCAPVTRTRNASCKGCRETLSAGATSRRSMHGSRLWGSHCGLGVSPSGASGVETPSWPRCLTNALLHQRTGLTFRLMSGVLSSFILHPSSFILHPSSFILHPSSFILHPSSFILHPSSFILHPSSFILHPSSFILHPSSFILHPSYFILHPSADTLGQQMVIVQRGGNNYPVQKG